MKAPLLSPLSRFRKTKASMKEIKAIAQARLAATDKKFNSSETMGRIKRGHRREKSVFYHMAPFREYSLLGSLNLN